jgi:hypothetical protein
VRVQVVEDHANLVDVWVVDIDHLLHLVREVDLGPLLRDRHFPLLGVAVDHDEEIRGAIALVLVIRGRRATEADSKHRFPVLESRPTEPGGPGVNREMVKKLHAAGLISRTPRQARTLQILVQPEELPVLRRPRRN